MGRFARLGLFCLMGLAIAMARLIEVELKPPTPTTSVECESEDVEESPAPDPAPAVSTTPPPVEQTVYTVRQGDTLGTISKRMYGTTRHWQRIYEANRDVIPNPKKMRAGVRLKIPAVQERTGVAGGP